MNQVTNQNADQIEIQELEIHEVKISKIQGASPSEDLFYILVMFDISDQKKYRTLTKVLKGLCIRIQYSVYEARLNNARFKRLVNSLTRIMKSETYFNPTDKIRIYKSSGNCELIVMGEYIDNYPERDVFI